VLKSKKRGVDTKFMKLESEVSEKVSKCYNKCQDALLAVLIAKGSVTAYRSTICNKLRYTVYRDRCCMSKFPMVL
jgi:hypothetical protein